VLELRHYAYMAADVYGDSSDIGLYDQSIANGFFRVSDFKNTLSRSGDLYCELYIYFVNGEAQTAIISVRGTDTVGNVIQDVKSWFDEVTGIALHGNYPSKYINKVLSFYHSAQRYMTAKYSNKLIPIIICGHSLGGAIAKLMVAQYGVVKAVVFNAPGVARLVVNAKNTNSIFCLDATYGIINKLGHHLPNMHNFQVDVPNYSVAAELLIKQFRSKGQHEFINAMQTDMHKESMWSHIKGLFAETKILIDDSKVLTSIPSFKAKLTNCRADTELENNFDLFSQVSMQFREKLCKVEQYINEYYHIINEQHTINNMQIALLSARYHQLACMLI
jgi:hypothetical protein